MKSQIDKIFYFKKYELMSRVINFLHFKRSKGDDVFNIDVRRSIFVYNSDMRCYIKRTFFNKRNKNRRSSKSRRFNENDNFIRRSFSNEGSCFYKYNCLTRN